jgi:hypothetical protein
MKQFEWEERGIMGRQWGSSTGIAGHHRVEELSGGGLGEGGDAT